MERDQLSLLFTAVALLALIYGFFHARDQIRAAPKVDRHTARKEVGVV
jgi:hypothetical protein